ncbi:Glutathione S-transferase omega-1 [Monoraphidium neglectum]|uniref:Glutathione S-transferase omega-1 n=1 Tax=Monoraphidium neglectum TaxID=145388 RepID=A0A0D2MJI2_9CHLO|nr:Glutathione S-transferase omega-1 [Monoraphidium neglectum]KIY95125.1 Glutathione S-transferase omega-1 [Monoraphidium neglectum]|eukprot:XP_013894145.1 Glutathione S-transferase omega-1 [Monoraphidium neglectum]
MAAHDVQDDTGPQLQVDKPTVISSWFCPFAQRTLLALNAKGVAYVHHELSDTDLYSKPAWFLDLNPAGLVPTLAWLTPGGERRVLGESLIINEYVDEALPGPNSLLPDDPFEKAQARLLIDRFSSRAVPEFYKLLLRQVAADQEAAATAFSAQLEWLTTKGLHPQGPFALGTSFTLVDAAILPFLLRLMYERYADGSANSQVARDIKNDKTTS